MSGKADRWRNDRPASTRTLAVVVPDWPAVAAGLAPGEPAVVVSGNVVTAVTEAARSAGVRAGLARREAQARCPELKVVPADEARDARELQPVLAAVGELCPRLEVVSPGCCTFPTRGPSRYFGGDRRLALKVEETVGGVLAGRGTVRVGVADGRFTARVAAGAAPAAGRAAPAAGGLDTGAGRAAPAAGGLDTGAGRAGTSGPGRGACTQAPGGADVVVIPAGGSAEWLAGLPVSVLLSEPGVSADLVDLFRRLGLLSLGLVAALPAGQVSVRFGAEGLLAHRLASGRDDRPARLGLPPEEVAVEMGFETPVERAETAGFAARALAGQLSGRLAARGVSCALLLVVAESEHGERCERRWRLGPGPLEAAVAERVRWQLDGWLSGPAAGRPSAGVTLLRLVPEEVAPAGGIQLQLWGQPSTPPERVVRAVARLEGLLGPGAVTVPEWRGGRQPDQRSVLVPAVAADLAQPRAAASAAVSQGAGAGGGVAPPWPGALPSPSPTVVYGPAERPAVEVLDRRGEPFRVDDQGMDGRGASAGPAVVVAHGRPRKVVGWAGPWPLVERWWDRDRRCRQARFQVLLEDGEAYLLVLEAGRWLLAGVYD